MIRKAKAGDGKAIEGLIRAHQDALYAFMLRMSGRPDVAEDIVQEAFVRVLRARTTGELQSPKAFLFATARNLALDQLRRHHISRTDSLVEADCSNVLDDCESIPDHVAANPIPGRRLQDIIIT